MKKYKLGDILELQRGYDLPLSQQETGNVLVAGSNGIIGSHNEARGNHPCITVGRSGSVGKVHYYEQPTWAHNTTLFVKDFKGNSPRYLYYFLKNLHLDKMFAKGSSVVPSLDRNVVHSLVVPFPKDIVFQQRIASVLSNLDRKITLNRSINHNLEAMAKQLYDYWFVQFDFPDENGKPYKSSGGKMVWNEKLKREIPEGWDDVILNDFLIIKNGRDHKLLATGNYPVYGSGGEMRRVSAYLYNGEAILMPRKGSLNNIMYVNKAFWTVDTMFYSEMKIPNCAKYVFFAIKDIDFTRWDSGTGVPSMTASLLYSIPLVEPNDLILQIFDNVLLPIFQKLEKVQLENENLAKLRDSLLPLLMNGQVSVNYDLASIISQLHDVKKAYFTNHRGRQVTKFVYICAEENSTRGKGGGRWEKSRRLLSQNSAVFRHSGGVFARGRPPKHGSCGRCPPLPSDSGV